MEAAYDRALTGLRWDHVRIVAGYAMRFALRTGAGLLAMLVVLTAGLGVGGIVAAPLEQFMAHAPETGHSGAEAASQVDKIARDPHVSEVVANVTGADPATVEYLLRTQPALLSAVFIVLLWLFPFITCIACANQSASDIGNRGLRYVLLRTERANVFLGRFLGSLAFLAISIAIVFVLFAIYVGIKFDIYPLGELLGWSVQGAIAILLLSLPYAALCAWLSALMDGPFSALAVCLLATGFSIVFLNMLGSATTASFPLARLLPWGWKYDLLSGDVGKRLLAYGVMLGFTLLFLGIGARSFSRRDV